MDATHLLSSKLVLDLDCSHLDMHLIQLILIYETRDEIRQKIVLGVLTKCFAAYSSWFAAYPIKAGGGSTHIQGLSSWKYWCKDCLHGRLLNWLLSKVYV